MNNIKKTTMLQRTLASSWLAVLFGPALVPGLLRVVVIEELDEVVHLVGR